ncbi:nucleotide sugar dehydrogenase [Curtobacterium herbarum]|uniref:nucleotide sugar dehydrogenase n=1 Tax=Curtobacterium herbarum TaxID=150122 RepID=UPI001C8DA7DF|nr:nucleotide sugar dehydrogenase [Curtobacterium herbarum]MBY0176537.1 nucleotide sugar dehydrogenase [Curtobacterium herbarum]
MSIAPPSSDALSVRTSPVAPTTTTVPTSPDVSAPLSSSVPLTRGTTAHGGTRGFEFDVAIVGLGYVGLPTALAYHHSGTSVIGLDVSQRRLETIRSRGADLLDDDRVRLESAFLADDFVLTDDPSMLARAAAVIVCVPTPVDEYLVPDLAILRGAAATVVEHAVPGQLLMLTSTTYVGCTDDLLVQPLTERGLLPGRDVFVAFSPERIDPGNASVAHEDVPRVLGAATPECAEIADEMLGRYARVHRVPSLAAAEMTKLLENTFRAVNIALANEFSDICRTMGIDVADVVDAAATKPYGFMAFMPGPGVGGHCIPCDPHYLLWQLKADRQAAPMITQAMTEIAARPGRVVDRTREVLSDAGRGLRGARVLVVGIAYKRDVADLRESPALEILEGLIAAGAEVGFADHRFDSVRLNDGTVLDDVVDETAFAADVVLLHTRHTDADLSWITGEQLVIDTTYRAADLTGRILL